MQRSPVVQPALIALQVPIRRSHPPSGLAMYPGTLGAIAGAFGFTNGCDTLVRVRTRVVPSWSTNAVIRSLDIAWGANAIGTRAAGGNGTLVEVRTDWCQPFCSGTGLAYTTNENTSPSGE